MQLKDDFWKTHSKLLHKKLILTFSKLYEINLLVRKAHDRLKNYFKTWIIKGALSGRSQFLGTESPLKMMKNAVYFTLKSFLS